MFADDAARVDEGTVHTGCLTMPEQVALGMVPTLPRVGRCDVGPPDGSAR